MKSKTYLAIATGVVIALILAFSLAQLKYLDTSWTQMPIGEMKTIHVIAVAWVLLCLSRK